MRPFLEWECFVAVFIRDGNFTCGWRFAGLFRCGRLGTLWACFETFSGPLPIPVDGKLCGIIRSTGREKINNGRNNFFIFILREGGGNQFRI